MSHIHFAGAILQSTQAARQQAEQKSRQLQREQELQRNIALEDDQLEHQVESTEAAGRIRRDEDQDHPRRRQDPREEDVNEPHIDVTA